MRLAVSPLAVSAPPEVAPKAWLSGDLGATTPTGGIAELLKR
jgi:hypothetical protein